MRSRQELRGLKFSSCKPDLYFLYLTCSGVESCDFVHKWFLPGFSQNWTSLLFKAKRVAGEGGVRERAGVQGGLEGNGANPQLSLFSPLYCLQKTGCILNSQIWRHLNVVMVHCWCMKDAVFPSACLYNYCFTFLSLHRLTRRLWNNTHDNKANEVHQNLGWCGRTQIDSLIFPNL